MAAQRLPLAVTAGEREPAEAKDPLLKNCYKETERIVDSVSKTEGQMGEKMVYVTKRPGLASHDDLSAATTDTGRGLFNWDGTLYTLVGDELFADETDLGQINTTSGMVHFDIAIDAEDGDFTLCFQDGTTIYSVDAEGNIASFNNGGSGGATDIEVMPTAMQPGLVALDQYVFVLDAEGFVYNSTVGDVTSGYTDTLNLEMKLDGGVRILRYRNYILALSEKTVEILFDAANPSGSPLNRFDGMAQLHGCAAANSAVNCDDSILYVAQSDKGGRWVGIIKEGFETKRISTSAIDGVLDNEGTNITDAYGFYLRHAGHAFYVLTLPTTAGRTFVYDIAEDAWYEWTSDVSDTETYFTGVDSAEFEGKQIILDENNGLLYSFDDEQYRDATGAGNETIKVQLRTANWDANNMLNKFCWRTQVIGDLNSATGTVEVAWSDDDYQNYTTDRDQDLDNHQSWLTRCGMFKRRSWRIKHEQNQPMRLHSLEVNIDQGHYGRS